MKNLKNMTNMFQLEHIQTFSYLQEQNPHCWNRRWWVLRVARAKWCHLTLKRERECRGVFFFNTTSEVKLVERWFLYLRITIWMVIMRCNMHQTVWWLKSWTNCMSYTFPLISTGSVRHNQRAECGRTMPRFALDLKSKMKINKDDKIHLSFSL